MENSRPEGTSTQGMVSQTMAEKEPLRQIDPYERQARRGLNDQGRFDSSPWKDNHGNLLLGFLALLCLVGVAVIAIQQARLRSAPPRFPDKIDQPGDSDIDPLNTAAATNANADQDLRTVELRIIGAASDKGMIKIAMYDKSEGFNDPRNALGIDAWTISDGVCTGKLQMPASIRGLAVSAYHDENGNGQLDKNAVGIPSERYGFSGGARGLTGPPSYEEATVSLDGKPIDVSIR